MGERLSCPPFPNSSRGSRYVAPAPGRLSLGPASASAGLSATFGPPSAPRAEPRVGAGCPLALGQSV
eukprot:5514526-Pyramimonas_sp.AAC.1